MPGLVSEEYCRGVSPAQQASGAVREPGDVPDLGDEHRGEHRPDALDLEQRLVAGVVLAAGGAWSMLDQAISSSSISSSRRWEASRDA